MSLAPRTASPCVSICILDPETELCRGCYRTIDEIAGWQAMDKAARSAVLARIAERRRGLDAEAREEVRQAARQARRAGRRRPSQRDR
jgi:hypothetical protein